MIPALKKLVEADAALELAKRAVDSAQEYRWQCALGLREIEDHTERWHAVIFAYRTIGKGLTLPLAEAATGLSGPDALTAFLARARRKDTQPAPRRISRKRSGPSAAG